MSVFPGAIPVFTGFTGSHTLLADNHDSQHNLEQAEIINIATKVGTGSSTASSGTLLRGTGVGSSAWQQVTLTTDVTGVLPVANGGTGQSTLTGVPLASPTISGVVAGGATYTSPTLTTPTVADFTNATHNHQNNAGGGQLGVAAISNTITFHAYRTVAQSIPDASYTKVLFDGENWDDGSNYDNITNFRFTAPSAGLYDVSACVSVLGFTAANQLCIIHLYKNGLDYKRLGLNTSGGANDLSASGSTTVKLATNDYLEIFVFQNKGGNLNTATDQYTWFGVSRAV